MTPLRRLLISFAVAAALSWSAFAQDAPPPAEEPTGGVEYTVEIIVPDDPDLAGAVENISLLVDRADTPPASAGELVSRALEDTARVTALLYTRGRYGGLVTVRTAGVPAAEPGAEAAITRALASGPVPVTVTVDPGPQFVFGDIRIEGRANGNDFDPAALGMVEGAPALSDRILQAEQQIVTALRNEGYPLAAVPSREVIADHATSRLDVTLHVESGEKANLGGVEVLGNEKLDADLVRRLAPFEAGEPYHPSTLARYRDRLRELPILAAAVVRTGDTIAPDGTIPVVVEVSERLPRVVGAGAFYSTDDGVAVNAYWGHRNLFGNGEDFRIEGEIGGLFESDWADVDMRLAMTFMKPALPTARDDLLAAMTFTRETTDAYWREAAEAEIGIRRRLTENLMLEAGVAFEATRIEDTNGTQEYLLLSAPITATFDNTDDDLDPTSGFRYLLEAEPIIDLGDGGLINVFSGEASAYYAIDEAERFVLAGRVAAGTIIGAALDDVPISRRFFAGGGGSVRGFAFQSASPRDFADNIIGGLSLFEASLELRARVTDTIGIVPFVDVGRAFEGPMPDFGDLKIGAGIGLRYLTPIGPLRLDAAVPLNPGPGDPSFSLYLGLGQAF
ncbi:MAG: outer membrane protein assembly factor [Bauldia sp.]|nr:outer membrane protein assembly factor [Bauldia sp.]